MPSPPGSATLSRSRARSRYKAVECCSDQADTRGSDANTRRRWGGYSGPSRHPAEREQISPAQLVRRDATRESAHLDHGFDAPIDEGVGPGERVHGQRSLLQASGPGQLCPPFAGARLAPSASNWALADLHTSRGRRLPARPTPLTLDLELHERFPQVAAHERLRRRVGCEGPRTEPSSTGAA